MPGPEPGETVALVGNGKIGHAEISPETPLTTGQAKHPGIWREAGSCP